MTAARSSRGTATQWDEADFIAVLDAIVAEQKKKREMPLRPLRETTLAGVKKTALLARFASLAFEDQLGRRA